MSAVIEPPRPLGLSPLLDHIRKEYSLAGVEVTMELGGFRHFNVLVTTGYGPFVVRVHPAGLNLDRLLAIQAARKALAAGGVPATVVRPTRSGESWTRYEGQLVELGAFVDYTAKMDSWTRLDAALPLLGRVHNILRTANLNPEAKRPPNSPHLGVGEAFEWTRRAVAHLRSWPLDPAQERFVATAEALASGLQRAEDPLRGRPSMQLVHGDFWDNAVLFRSGKVVLVTGLDFMGERPRVEDLAWTLYRANSAFSDDPLSGHRLRRLRGLVEAYDSGLSEHLTPEERAALPLAIARSPLFVMRDLAQLERKSDVVRPMVDLFPDLRWAAAMALDLKHWQDGFA